MVIYVRRMPVDINHKCILLRKKTIGFDLKALMNNERKLRPKVGRL